MIRRWFVYLGWRERVGPHVNFTACCAIYHIECEDAPDMVYSIAVNRGIVFG